jgi:hypothetical protein
MLWGVQGWIFRDTPNRPRYLVVVAGAGRNPPQACFTATHETIGSHPPAGSVTALPGEESPIREIHAHLCGFHFYSGDPLPLGLPKLMMGFAADGPADPAMVAARDRDEHIEYGEIRAGMPTCPPGRSRRERTA